MKQVFIIFPNQLYANIMEHIPSNYTPVMIEEPVFFYDAQYRPFQIHKLRIAFMRATMQHYYKTVLPSNALYIDYNQSQKFYKTLQKSKTQIKFLYPHDKTVLAKYTNLFNSTNQLQVLEDPYHFLLSIKDLDTIKKTTTNPHLTTIYNYLKHKYKIPLTTTPSTDQQNRLPLPPNPPKTSRTRPTFHRPSDPLVKQASVYTQNHFSKHPGSTELLQHLPLTHQQAAQYLDIFIKQRFANYGPYQDAIDACDTIIYHSHISYLINCGLLTPHQVVKTIMQKHKQYRIPINSLEGFIRQLIGWREYMRYIYEQHYDTIQPIFAQPANKQHPSLPKSWYTGTTTITPLDHEIRKLQGEAYAHHIIRLMVFLNLAKLYDFHPAAIYRWFMEMVALDAYEWVMYSNIAAMGMYDTRFMSKPYLSTSNYILKMSNYEQDPKWTKQWDAAFYNYLTRHKPQLQGKYAIYLRNLAYFEKQTPQRRREILAGRL